MKKKTWVLVLALALVVMGVAAGTLAWLTAESGTITNTFTTSDIKVMLTETEEPYKMVPGYDIHKDPKTTVTKGSEECYLFVKLEKSKNFKAFMTYEVDVTDGNWTRLTGTGITDTDEIYYRKVLAGNMGTAYSVLKDDKVTVRDTVTKAMMDDLKEQAYPTMTVTAYASQLYKNAAAEFTAIEAWNDIQAS